MTTQSFYATLPRADAERVRVLADSYRAAMCTAFAGVGGAPRDAYVQRFLDNIKRADDDGRRDLTPEKIARLHLCALADRARPADLLKLPHEIEAVVAPDYVPPPAQLRLVSVDEERTNGPLNVLQAQLDATAPDSLLHEIVDLGERQIAETRRLVACARAALAQRAIDRQRARATLGLRDARRVS